MLNRDVNKQRHCTVPNIFGFRKWFESQYGLLCEQHDTAYVAGGCLLCADISFIRNMIKWDWQDNKWNLFFSIPAAPIIFLVFTAYKVIYKKRLI